MSVITSAPGKILLLGGYSVLERPNVAYVLAVNAFVHAALKTRKDHKVVISIPQFKTKIETTTSEIANVKNESGKFVLSAIASAFQYFKFKSITYSGFEITTKSDAAFALNKGKSGLGSSAAVTVATVKGLFKAFAQSESIDTIHKIAQLAHARAQNKIGSGFDIAAACFGSIKYVRYSPELLKLETKLNCEIKKINLPEQFKLVFASFPKQSMSTTNAVAKVMEFKKNNKSEYAALIQELNAENEQVINALEKNNLDEFKIHFENGRLITKKLGELSGVEIESNAHSALIEETKKNGAFVAKLPGAGGGDSIVALCLTVREANKVKRFWKKRGLNILRI